DPDRLRLLCPPRRRVDDGPDREGPRHQAGAGADPGRRSGRCRRL
ncbi:MAG: hypothetical protein AVDCRST_MAG73-4183, partial [uncultured Thermomicrobiales bacterium]